MTESRATTTSEADWRRWSGSNVTVRAAALTIATGDGDGRGQSTDDPERSRRAGRAVQRYDAGTAGTEWHRVRVRTNRPSPNTRVGGKYLAVDEPLGSATTGHPEADRGEVASGTEGVGVAPETGAGESGGETIHIGTERLWPADRTPEAWTTLDVTEQDDHRLAARGRYLYVGLELVGTSDAAPSVESVQAFCGREPIRRHLPDLYDGSPFLDDLLAVFETVFDDVERERDRLTEYLDPAAAPREALDWLESWFAVEHDEAWPESARRELLARAPELYRKRGTRAGVRELVELHLRHAGDSTVGTVWFLARDDLDCIDDGAVRAAVAAALPDAADVVCYHEATAAADVIEAVVTSETPAHVPTAVAPLEPSCSLDGATFLGCNSRLTRRRFALGETTLHGNSTLDGSDSERNDHRRPTDPGDNR